MRAAVLVVATFATVGCSSEPPQAVRTCVDRWNGSIARTNALGGIASGTEANVAVVDGHCLVTLMGENQRALVFKRGNPRDGVGGFLFQGSIEPEKLPAWQRPANTSAGLHFRLTLRK